MTIEKSLTEVRDLLGQAQWEMNWQLGKRTFSKTVTGNAVKKLEKSLQILQPLIGNDAQKS